MSQVSFYLPKRASKSKKGFTTVMMNVPTRKLNSSARLQISTGIKIQEDWWNKGSTPKTLLLSSKHPSCDLLEQKLKEIKTEMEELYATLIINGVRPSSKELKEHWLTRQSLKKQERDEKVSFLDFVHSIATKPEFWKSSLEGEIKLPTTLEVYATLHKHLIGYKKATGTQITWESLGVNFRYGFINYLKDSEFSYAIESGIYPRYPKEAEEIIWNSKGGIYFKKKLDKSSVNKYLTRISSVLKEATRHGYDIPMETIVNSSKGLRLNEEDKESARSKKVAFSDAELKVILNEDLSSTPQQEKYRDYFIAGCNLGLRIVDFKNLTNNNVIVDLKGQKWVEITPRKTRKSVASVKIPINTTIQTIIEKYKSDDFLFPEMKPQEFNSIIKLILRRIGGRKDEPIYKSILRKANSTSAHDMRRTLCTLMVVEWGLPSEVAMRVSGHKKLDSFLEYISLDQNRYDDLITQAFMRSPLANEGSSRNYKANK